MTTYIVYYMVCNVKDTMHYMMIYNIMYCARMQH